METEDDGGDDVDQNEKKKKLRSVSFTTTEIYIHLNNVLFTLRLAFFFIFFVSC